MTRHTGKFTSNEIALNPKSGELILPVGMPSSRKQAWPDRLDAALFEAILDCIHEAVCVVDADGTVRFWNRASEELYSVPRQRILGRPVVEFFPNAMVDTVRLSRTPERDVEHTPREGTHILITAKPLHVHGAFLGAVCSDRDYAEVMRLYGELEHAQSRVDVLETELRKLTVQFSGMVGNSPVFLEKIQRASQIAASSASVLLSGESGTGKEVFARKIHELSGREGMFVAINCAAIPQELFESECFGYAPGAFTGANPKGKPGFFELANNGTVFLDEICDLPLPMQTKLLRVLQERELMRVGGEKTLKLDVRVISASNRDLEAQVTAGSFREDLFYRLKVVEIALPPLRDRKEDIPLLIKHYIQEFSSKNRCPIKGVQPEVTSMLQAHKWPGNIRELINVLENMVVTEQSTVLTKDSVPDYIRHRLSQNGEMLGSPSWEEEESSMDLAAAVERLERQLIAKALSAEGNNKSKAAKRLKMPRATLYHKISQYGLEGTNAEGTPKERK